MLNGMLHAGKSVDLPVKFDPFCPPWPTAESKVCKAEFARDCRDI